MKPTVVSADVLFEEFRGRLRWEWVAGLGASERRFDDVAVRAARSGADLVGYLQWMGEPAQNTRVRIGVWVLLFMSLLVLLAWRLNESYWKEVK